MGCRRGDKGGYGSGGLLPHWLRSLSPPTPSNTENHYSYPEAHPGAAPKRPGRPAPWPPQPAPRAAPSALAARGSRGAESPAANPPGLPRRWWAALTAGGLATRHVAGLQTSAELHGCPLQKASQTCDRPASIRAHSGVALPCTPHPIAPPRQPRLIFERKSTGASTASRRRRRPGGGAGPPQARGAGHFPARQLRSSMASATQQPLRRVVLLAAAAPRRGARRGADRARHHAPSVCPISNPAPPTTWRSTVSVRADLKSYAFITTTGSVGGPRDPCPVSPATGLSSTPPSSSCLYPLICPSAFQPSLVQAPGIHTFLCPGNPLHHGILVDPRPRRPGLWNFLIFKHVPGHFCPRNLFPQGSKRVLKPGKRPISHKDSLGSLEWGRVKPVVSHSDSLWWGWLTTVVSGYYFPCPAALFQRDHQNCSTEWQRKIIQAHG